MHAAAGGRHAGRRAAQREVWFPVNDSILNTCWTLYLSDPVLAACRSVVLNELLGMGVMYSDAHYSRLSSEEFFLHVQRFFPPFCRAAVDALYVQGFVAYTLDKKAAVPTVIPYGAGTYMMRLNKDFRLELGFFDGTGDKPSKDVFFEVERMPDLSGTPSSAMVAYFRARAFKDEIERTVSMAETLRSRPPLYTTTESRHAFTKDMVYDQVLPTRESRVQNEMSESLERANMLVRNRLLMDAYSVQDDLVRALNSRGLDTGAPGALDPTTGMPTFGDKNPDVRAPGCAPAPAPRGCERGAGPRRRIWCTVPSCRCPRTRWSRTARPRSRARTSSTSRKTRRAWRAWSWECPRTRWASRTRARTPSRRATRSPACFT